MQTILRGDRGSRAELAADCARCVGLCCVALAFARSSEFAFDKAAGDPCVNLADDHRCRIHPELRERGFSGCTVFDCFGAGQQVTQHTFGGGDWRERPELRGEMFAVFPIVRQLHELLWYLDEAVRMPAAGSLRPRLQAARDEVALVADAPAEHILSIDVDDLRAPIAELLRTASRLTREANRPAAAAAHDRRIAPGADLLGANLAGRDLRGAELRGALLIAADLSGADLSYAELIGADLRDANIGGADLRTAIYLTQMQVNAAHGDARTLLPDDLLRPSHWGG
ncbi:pentapeptide repeat-containing protein [Leifsonia lichenia]